MDIDSLSAIQPNAVANKDSASVLIFCDGDSRWQEAPDDIVPTNSERPAGKKAWYDAANNFLFDTKGFGDTFPGCRTPDADPRTMAQTYCNSLNRGDKRCTITICNGALSATFLTLSDTPGMKLMLGTKANGKRSIDRFAVLSNTVLHEVCSIW